MINTAYGQGISIEDQKSFQTCVETFWDLGTIEYLKILDKIVSDESMRLNETHRQLKQMDQIESELLFEKD